MSYFILVSCVTGFLWGCAFTPVKQEILIFKDHEVEKRVNYLLEQLRKNPNDVEKRTELGKIFLSEDMIDEAVAEIEKALQTDSRNVQALLLLSSAFQKLPKPDLTKALSYLEKASLIEPDNGDVHLYLAQIHNKLNDENKAMSEFNRAIELSKDPATLVSAHLGLMAIYKKQGESEKADEEYETAYKIYPNVEEMIKQAEINYITPKPQYGAEEFGDDDGWYPPIEERIKRAKEEIMKLSGGEK